MSHEKKELDELDKVNAALSSSEQLYNSIRNLFYWDF